MLLFNKSFAELAKVLL